MKDPWFTPRQRPRNWKGWRLPAVGVVAGGMDEAGIKGAGFGVAIGAVVSGVVGLMFVTSERVPSASAAQGAHISVSITPPSTRRQAPVVAAASLEQA